MTIREFAISLVVLISIVANVHAQTNNDRFKRWDSNEDGQLIKTELPEQNRNIFDRLDADRNGIVTRQEYDAFIANRNRARTQTAEAPAPTHADVSYGQHEKQAFDIWLAESSDGKPTPLVIYIHGGGFRGGDKRSGSGQPVQDYLDHGISFASMNYRLSDVGPYPIMMHDAARGLQYIRSKSEKWNLDPARVACYGGSAGAGISLWLGFHDDLADRDSDDPVARESTRIVAAGTQGGQSTYDMRTFREWFSVPNLEPHPALVTLYAVETDADWQSDRVKKLMTDASPITHLTKDDCPVFMTYGRGDVPVDENTDPGVWVHHARLGLKLKEAMNALGLECHVTWRQNASPQYEDIHDFLKKKVRAE